jgi:hypothetical protein
VHLYVFNLLTYSEKCVFLVQYKAVHVAGIKLDIFAAITSGTP